MKPSCDFEPWIAKRAAELLDDEQAARLDAHLPGCEVCRAAARRMDGILEAARVPLTPRDEWALEQVSEGLRSPARFERSAAPSPLTRWSHLAERALPIAAGLVAVLLLGVLVGRNGASSPSGAMRGGAGTTSPVSPAGAMSDANDPAVAARDWAPGGFGDMLELLPADDGAADDAATPSLLADLGPGETSALYDAVAFETGSEP